MKTIHLFVAVLFLLNVASIHAEEIKYREFLQLNAANITKINIGMSEDEVKVIMGDYTSAVRSGSLNNPWRIESSGSSSVYHYLTKKNPPFTPILEHQATPVLIKDGKVFGVGRGFLKEFRNNSMNSSSINTQGKTIEERMTTLRNLLDSGAIDKATYEKQKQKILDDI